MNITIPFDVRSIKLMLHETIRKDDFWHNTALQCWNNVTLQPFATILQRCVALKLVVL